MILPPSRRTRTVTLLPYTTPFRSTDGGASSSSSSSSAATSAWPLHRQRKVLTELRAEASKLSVVDAEGFILCDERYSRIGLPSLQFAALSGLSPFHYRSEEHTSELQSLMRTSYAVFCLKKNK